MAKNFYYLEKKGFGRSFYYLIRSLPQGKAQKLKNLGIKVFDTRSEAQEYIKGQK